MLLNWTGNRTAIAWARKAASTNSSGKALSCILCAAQRDQKLGLTSDFIQGKFNITADAISCIHPSSGCTPNFTTLKQVIPGLQGFHRFLISRQFLSILLQALLTGLDPGVDLPKIPG